MDFIIAMIFMSLTFGTFFGLLFYENSRLQKTKKTLYSIIIALVAGFIITFVYEMDYNREVELWNNGKCSCGTEWEFVNASKHKEKISYFWKCNNCNKVIDLEYQFEK